VICTNAKPNHASSGDAYARGSVRRAPDSQGTACHSAISPHQARKAHKTKTSSIQFDVWKGGNKTIIKPLGIEGNSQKKERKKSKRGKIREMTKGSSRRLRRKLAEVIASTPAYTLCLSYPELFPDIETAQIHLQKLGRWVDRHFPNVGIFWKREPQERGATHYHLLMFGTDDFDAALATGHAIARKWCEISSEGLCEDMKEKQLRVHLFMHKNNPNHRKNSFQRMKGESFFNYLGKYISKHGQKYPDGYGSTGGCGWWGVWNRKAVPWAEQKTRTVEIPLHKLKAFMRAMYRLREQGIQKQLDALSPTGDPRGDREKLARALYRIHKKHGWSYRDAEKTATKMLFKLEGARRAPNAPIKVKSLSRHGSITFLGDPEKQISIAERFFSKRINTKARARIFSYDYVPPASGGQSATLESGGSRDTKSAI